MPEIQKGHIYLDMPVSRVNFLVGKKPEVVELSSDEKVLQLTKKVGLKPAHYEISDERLEELMSPDYVPHFVPDGQMAESAGTSEKSNASVKLARLQQDEAYQIKPEIEEWGSREEKTQTIVRIQELEKLIAQNPEDEALAEKARELKGRVAIRDERLIFWAVANLAPWYKRRLTDDQIYSAGTLGTLQAIKKFDPNRGFQFTTYQVPAILREVGRAAMAEERAINTPQHADILLKEVYGLQERLIQEQGRYMGVEEVLKSGDYTDAQKNTVRNALWARRTSSLDRPLTQDDEDSFGDILPASNLSPEDQVLSSETSKYVRSVVLELSRNDKYGKESLTFHEARALDLKFGLSTGTALDIEEIADELGKKRRTVSVYLSEAFRKIRTSPFADGLLDYLRNSS